MSTSGSSSSSRPQLDHPRKLIILKFIDALRHQGINAENFNELRNLPENKNSFATFCFEAELKLDVIGKALKNENIDFRTVINIVEMIRSAADRVGGSRLLKACTKLQQHCTDNNIARSVHAYKNVNWEYYVLRDCFHHILQAERTVDH